MVGEMLDGDWAVADAALPIEKIVATALQCQHIDGIAQTDGRRLERHVQDIVGRGGGIADIGQAVAEDEQRRWRRRRRARAQAGRVHSAAAGVLGAGESPPPPEHAASASSSGMSADIRAGRAETSMLLLGRH